MAKITPDMLQIFIISLASALDHLSFVDAYSSFIELAVVRPRYVCNYVANLAEVSLPICGSCQYRCGEVNTRSPASCSCDSACVVYGDCCLDFQEKCPEIHKRANGIRDTFEGEPRAKCLHIGDRNVTLINSCVRTVYGYHAIRGIPDVHTQVPVLDLDTGIFYINLNCAKCNGARRLQAVGIDLKYGDRSLKNAKSNMKNKGIAASALSTAEGVVGVMRSQPTVSYNFRGMPVRQCYRNLVDQCSGACYNKELVDLCRIAGQSYVKDKYEYKTYRNPYCALCNHQPINTLSCVISDRSLSFAGISPPLIIRTFSLSYIFDLRELESPMVSSVSLQCSTKDMELPDGVVCGETICPSGYKLRGDTCNPKQRSGVKSRHPSSSLRHLSPIAVKSRHPSTANRAFGVRSSDADFLESRSGDAEILESRSGDADFLENNTHFNNSPNVSPCKGVRIPEASFTIENGSLILTGDDRVYSEGDYVMDNGSAVICLVSTYSDFSGKSALGITTIILCSVSLLCLSCRLILQVVWQKFHSFPGRMQFNFVLAMALSTALLLFSPLARDVDRLCFTLAVLKYFAFLSTFVWMTCVAGDAWWALRSQLQERASILVYLLVGWLLPLIFTAITLSVDLSDVDPNFDPQFGGPGCWITQRLPLILYFFVPFFITTTLNVVFFLLTIRTLKTAFQVSETLKKSKNLQHPWQVYLKLFIIMGLAWLVGFVAIWVDSVVVWFFFVILNASQGIFISMALVVNFTGIKNMFRRERRASSAVTQLTTDGTASTQTTKV